MSDSQWVTCVSIGVYEHAVSKGSSYEVLEVKNENYRIKGNHGRLVWVSKIHFVEGIVEVPILLSWTFDDDINEYDFVDVTFTFTNGSKRWAIITTPEKLQKHFKRENVFPPGFNTHHLIILRSLSNEDVESTFRNLELQGRLESATLSLTPEKDAETSSA